MSIQGISSLNSTQPLRSIQAGENNMNKVSKFTMAYIPSEIYYRYCNNGYCAGNFLNYFA